MKRLLYGLVIILGVLLIWGSKPVSAAQDKPGEFEITSPDSGDTFEEGESVTLKWSNSEGCDVYIVNVRDLTTNELIVQGKETESRSYKISASKLEAGHKYRAAVSSAGDAFSAKRSGGEVTFTVTEAKKVEKPGEFEITAPSSGSVFEVGKDVQLEWDESDNCDEYRVSVRDITTDKLIIDKKKTTRTYYKIDGDDLVAGHKYRVAVMSYRDDCEEGRSGGEVTFTVAEAKKIEKPGEFEITSPNSGKEYEAGSNVTIKWSTSQNSDEYLVSVRDLTTNALIIDKEETTKTSYTIYGDELVAGHKYRAAVMSYRDDCEEGRSGGEVTFTVAEAKKIEKPGEFEITSPNSGKEYEAGSNVTIKWSTSQNSDEYLVSVRDLTTNALIIDKEETTKTSYTIYGDELVAGHKYRAAVMSYRDDCEEGRSGGEVTFTVAEEKKVEKPGEFAITSPDIWSEYEPGDNVTLRWTKSENSDEYLVSVRDLTTNVLIIDKEETTKTSYTISGYELEAGHQYRAAVMSYRDDCEEGRSGGEVIFTVTEEKKVEKPGEFAITSPNVWSEYEDGTNITLKWTKSENSDVYLVSVRDLTTNVLIVDKEETTKTSYTISGYELEAGHQYRVAVMSYRDDCEEGRSGGEVFLSIAEKATPTPAPTKKPTATPTPAPTKKPTATPTPVPTKKPTATPTPVPTKKPTVTPIPAPTKAPKVTATPKPEAAEVETYVTGMKKEYSITEGEKITLNGKVIGDPELLKVTADVTDGWTSTGRVSVEPHVKKYDLSKLTLDTSALKPGNYTIRIWGKTEQYNAVRTAGTATLIVKEKPDVFGKKAVKLTFSNKEKELFASNSVVLFWDCELTDQQKAAVDYVVIQAYRKDAKGASKLAVNKQLNSYDTQYTLYLEGGLYGIEVSCYSAGNKVVATGQTQLRTPATISDFYIDDVTEGSSSNLYGSIKASSQIKKIKCLITDTKTQKTELELELPVSEKCNEYSLYRSEFDKKIKIGQLSAGTKKVVLSAWTEDGETVSSAIELNILKKTPEVTKAPAKQTEQSSFDFNLFTAGKGMKRMTELEIGGKKYSVYGAGSLKYPGTVYFVDSGKRLVTDTELLEKLIFTWNVYRTFYSETKRVGDSYQEQNELLVQLNKAITSFDELWDDVNQIAITSFYVEAVGVSIPALIPGQSAGLVHSYGNFIKDKTKDYGSYLFALEMSMSNVLLNDLYKAYEMAQSKVLYKYENAREYLRILCTTGETLELLRNSILDALDYSDVNNGFDKGLWWLQKTWEGFASGQTGITNTLSSEVSKGNSMNPDIMKRHVKKLQNSVEYGNYLKNSSQLASTLQNENMSEAESFLVVVSFTGFGAVPMGNNFAEILNDFTEAVSKGYNALQWMSSFWKGHFEFDESATVYAEDPYNYYGIGKNGDFGKQIVDMTTSLQSFTEPDLTFSQTLLAKGQKTTIIPIGMKKNASVTYKSEAPDYVSVDSKGNVAVLKSEGKKSVRITVEIVQDGITYKKYVTVYFAK